MSGLIYQCKGCEEIIAQENKACAKHLDRPNILSMVYSEKTGRGGEVCILPMVICPLCNEKQEITSKTVVFADKNFKFKKHQSNTSINKKITVEIPKNF